MQEGDEVVVTRDLQENGLIVPAGTPGTVVHRYGPKAVEVALGMEGRPVMTVSIDDLRMLPGGD